MFTFSRNIYSMENNHQDIIIVGAGISGICMANYLQEKCPRKKFIILDERSDYGGTWDLYDYPGIRSDSAMTSFGYKFKPWLSPVQFASGSDIKNYLGETIEEIGIKDRMQYDIRINEARWSNKTMLWTLKAFNKKTNENIQFTCNFLLTCCGYFDFKSANIPDFKNLENFKGRFFHPQFWPKDLELKDKKVVIIGSGATAATLLPTLAMSGEAKKVSLLQRSPSYFLIFPSEDNTINWLSKIIGTTAAFNLIRAKDTLKVGTVRALCAKYPEKAKKLFINGIKKYLPKDFDIETHFTPKYYPLEQRPLILPNADFLNVIKDGSGHIVTDHIDHFTESGIQLKSGQHLEADIVISATGLKLIPIGGIKVYIDDKLIQPNEHYLYKSASMMSGVPNLATIIGLGAASWTEKADLVAEHLCRIINYLDEKGYDCTYPDPDVNEEKRPFIDFMNSGYIKRAINDFPKQGQSAAWSIGLDFKKESDLLLKGPIDDGHLKFGKLSKQNS